jgi:hypothetical protein
MMAEHHMMKWDRWVVLCIDEGVEKCGNSGGPDRRESLARWFWVENRARSVSDVKVQCRCTMDKDARWLK